MGLIKTAISSAKSVLGDQYKEYFYCEALPTDVLAVKGKKQTSKGNKNGSDNIISNGSVIAVADGQCMMIVDQGKVVDICAEAGEFVYDMSSEPSIFFGKLSETIPALIKTMGKRVGFGGNTGKDQRVYYFNTKEIIGNKYGTPSPVPFRVVDNNIGLDVDVAIKCFGEYSYRISNPVLFYTNICGNVASAYTRDQLESQLKTELLTALQPAFARIGAMGIRYSALPGHTTEMAEALNAELSKKWAEYRGIEVVSFGVSSVKADEEDEKMIKELQKTAVFRNTNMAAAQMVSAQSAAMQAAASNTAGAPIGFMGMNMAQTAGGVDAASLFAMGAAQQQAAAPAAAPAGSWKCTSCGATATGKFCPECGSKKPAGALQYKCDKCGWEPEDPTNPPRFCPECGDPFNEQDVVG